MMDSRKINRGAVLLLASAFVLGACSQNAQVESDGATGADTSTEVQAITFVGTDPVEAFQPLIDAFHAKNPDIEVSYQNIPFDQYNNVIQQRVGSGDASIDVLLVDAGAVGSVASKGWLKDLTALQNKVNETSYPAAAKQNDWDGKMWALPMWTSAQYLYYNKTLLDAAGIAHPSIQSSDRLTWEEVTDLATQAKEAGAEWGLLFDQTDRYYQLQPLSESAGGGSGAAGEDLLTVDITNDGWIKAMTWYGELFEKGLAPRGIATDQMSQLFASGKAAFFVGGPWSVYPITEADNIIDFGVAPHPYFDGGTPAMSTGSWAIGVSSSSDAPDAAQRFAEFASLDPEGNAAAVAKIIIPPTNNDAFDDYITRLDTFHEPNTTGMGELTVSELSIAAVNRPNTLGFTQMQEVLGNAYADIRNGLPVEETLRKAQEELQRQWDRL